MTVPFASTVTAAATRNVDSVTLAGTARDPGRPAAGDSDSVLRNLKRDLGDCELEALAAAPGGAGNDIMMSNLSELESPRPGMTAGPPTPPNRAS